MTEEGRVPGMAEAIEARRLQLRLSPGDFARDASLTTTGLSPVRKGKRKDYSDKTTMGVARALRWPLDWYDRILAGQDPARFPEVDHGEPSAADEPADLTQTVARLADLVEELERTIRSHWPRAR